MAKIFISHSSKDKDFVRNLANDLTRLGHEPWLDEWEIKVGECIVSKVEHGITNSQYTVIVLSQNSVSSGWVEREWKAKYWDEINQGKTFILPVLIENCDIPPLLQTKKYADFRDNYSVALVELMGSISPTINKPQQQKELIIPKQNQEVTDLITKFQSRSIPLSQCISEAYSFARKRTITSLEKICSGELTGWYGDKLKEFYPKYRIAQVYVSIDTQINMQYFGWGGEVSNIINYLKNNPDEFTPYKLLFSQPISRLETDIPIEASKKIISITMKAKDIAPNFSEPNAPVYAYTDSNTYRNIIEAIRTEFTKRLMDM